MGAGRPGFALMVVLIAVAAVFALAMRGAVVARSTMLEVGALHDRVVGERRARAAAVIVLKGLTPAGEGAGGALEGGGAAGEGGEVAGGAAVSPAGEEGEGVEIPDFLKELIPELAEVEQKAREDVGVDEEVLARVSDGRGMTGRSPRRRGRSLVRELSEVGLPSEPVRVEVDGRAFLVRAWDALGLVNVNKAEAGQLMRYFEAKGVDPLRARALADQILDWRDRDDAARPLGAERETYGRMGVSCRNGELFALEELLFLPAMDRALFDSIEDELAVGGDGKVHVGSAPVSVLRSLPGVDAEVAESLMALRRAGRVDEESVRAVLPVMQRDAAMEMVRIGLQSVLRLRVEAVEGEDDHVIARFDGLAFLGPGGVQEVGLRPM